MSRWRAASTHLALSVAVSAGVLALMLLFWYPPPLFEVMGGADLALILIGVDVVLGPALTLIVFRSGKPGLKLDLTVIAACQLGALVYGCHVISLARPAFIVFVKDQFQVVTVAELAPERLAEARYPQFREQPWTGPQLVFGEWPTEPKDLQRLMDAVIHLEDLQHFPKHYAPYEQGRAEILSRSLPPAQVHQVEPEAAKVIDAWLASSGTRAEDVRYLRLRGRRGWGAVLVDRVTAQPVKMLLTGKD